MDIVDTIRKIFEKLRSDPLLTEIFGPLGGTLFFVALVSRLIEYAASRHWSLGVLLTAASGVLVAWIAIQAAPFRRQHPISIVLLFSFVMVFLGAVVCAGASYVLHVQGWASYGATQRVTMDSLRNYYLWTVLDMVPGLDIWKAIPVKSPVEPDAVGGIPVLLFRIFVLGFVFASVRRWWNLHAVARPTESMADAAPHRS
jgi:hypothetical protein